MAIDRETQRRVKETVNRWNKWLGPLGGAVSVSDALEYHERTQMQQQEETSSERAMISKKRRVKNPALETTALGVGGKLAL